MAEAGISTDQDRFSCPVCQELLKDPVTTPCGHSFCKVCINGFWDKEDQKGIYSCPECRDTFSPRPVLCRNKMLAEVVEELKDTELQSASTIHCYAGPGDVECDSCIGRKRKAVNSCLVCQASYCEDHLQPHYQSPAFKKHKLVKTGAELQKNLCFQHDKLMELYCRTDQSFICYLCMMDKHKGHDTVSTKTERTEKQNELKEEQIKSQQKIQEKQKKLHELKQTVDIIKAAEEDERIFNELISSMEKKRSEVAELIKVQEESEVSRAKRLVNQAEQEIADLKRRITEMEQLSRTHDDIHFLQSFPTLCVSPGCDDSLSFTVNQHLSFDGVRKSLSGLKKQVEQICEEEFNKIQPQAAVEEKILPSGLKINERNLQYVKKRVEEVLLPKIHPQAAAVQSSLPSEPDSREDFLQYFCYLTLDPNTVHPQLILSEKNRVVTRSETQQRYSDHPERFDSWPQVLCKESVCGHCYWEVERRGDVLISVSYKKISRKGQGKESQFGFSSQSWSLRCNSSSVFFWHNNRKTVLQGPSSSRIGVYVNPRAGTLSFYSVSDTMRLLHRVHTTFTHPLYAGFCIWSYDLPVSLCDPK
ncbi:E3 ubiquitin/ISG15 ligase TRIM25-like isoform X2 [Tachysurus vachellii]|uniref:E3 ubiquitin/ISG15 ligase TRIM25-like isoform X2 n=1 Tax=Tachysurus vachellii TaxID=175792 RepID=UPI00296ACC0E|nr:E3 ubiquitin/ISG15 ligase TRIM25-like isoform X2 [Tachysurus vachellii]